MENSTVQADKTKVYNGSNGWTAETYTNYNGQDYYITTSKGRKGTINSSSQTCERKPNGSVMFLDMMNLNNTHLNLKTTTGRATEKTIKAQHAEALLIFDEQVKELQPEKEPRPEIGTILFLDGYGKGKGSKENKEVIYSIVESEWGTNFLTVELDTLQLNRHDHVKNYANKFGIGMYFEPDYKYTGTQEDLNNLVIEAKQRAEAEEKRKEAEQLLKAQVRQGKIEEGKKLVKIPSWAKCVIVADHYQNDSDSMTDYFSTSVKQRVFLAFSANTRNNMKELRKAALNFEITKDFPQQADENTEREYKKVTEFTRGHSYLPNYFLGTSQWFGYKVHKEKYFDLSKEENRNALFIAAAENLYFIPEEEETTGSPEAKTKIEGAEIEIIDYSEKALAIIGDTKPYKDELKSIGARFNPRLKCGAGWVISKTKEDELNALFN